MMTLQGYFRLSILGLCLAFAGAAAGEQPTELIPAEEPDFWTGKVLPNRDITHSGKFAFESFGPYPTETIVKEFIPVSPEKRYRLSCVMRSLDADKPASAYFGLRMYDQEKRPIAICQVGAKAGSESELAEPAAAGDRQLLVKPAPGWQDGGHAAVAFNVRPGYADLPNFEISAGISGIEAEGAFLKVSLKGPLARAYPAGTVVRLHSPWGAPLYWIAKGWMTAEWQEFATVLQGVAESGTPTDQFWAGTRYVKPFFWFGNWDKKPGDDARLLVDEIRFRELPDAATK